MIIKQLVVGPLAANCFIIGCENTREAVVIDPGGDVKEILWTLVDEKLKVKYIINTHGHFDHTGGNYELKKATGAPIVIHRLDASMLNNISQSANRWGFNMPNSPSADIFVDEGDLISFGNYGLNVLHTPGHTPGSISLYGNSAVFVGDTLFAGSIGRTDFPGGDYQALINAVITKIFPLGDDVKVYPGHGPSTTVGQERRTNPFFQSVQRV